MTDTRTATADTRTSTVDIDAQARRLADEAIADTWSIRSPIDRYAALHDRRAALLQAARLVHEEGAHEIARLRRPGVTAARVAELITARARRLSETSVRQLWQLADRHSDGAEVEDAAIGPARYQRAGAVAAQTE